MSGHFSPHTPPSPPAAPLHFSGPRYKALYDYTASGDEEVSFVTGEGVTDMVIKFL